MKDKLTAILLSIFVGGLGIDRFYLGYTGIGVLKLLTFGCCGILSLIDLVRICTGSLQPANGLGYKDDNASPAQEKHATDPYEDLKKLSALKAQGLLEEDEYSRLKADLLAKMN